MAHPISSLYPFLRVELPGIPEPLLVSAVDKVIDEFLKKSELWKHTSPILLDWETTQTFPTLVAGTDIPTGARVVRIDTVKYASDGVNLLEIPFKTRQQLDGIFSNWEVKTGTAPLYWTYDGPETPRIIPIATANVLGSLQVRSIISSDQTTVVLPDWIVHEYEEVLKVGVLSMLMKIPGKDWTDLASAGAYAMLFKDGINKARSRANADYGQPCRETSYGGI
jgi:hypothetical protein